MKLILKENPDVELTVTVEYPKQSSQVSRIIQKLRTEEQFLIGSENCRNYKVLVSDIFYIESMGHTVQIHTATDTIAAYERLDAVTKRLPVGFIRCHKSFVVNMWQIRRFLPTDVLLKNEVLVPVSRKRYTETKEAYFRFMGQTF